MRLTIDLDQHSWAWRACRFGRPAGRFYPPGMEELYREIRLLQRKFEIMAEVRTAETWTTDRMRSSQPTIDEYLSQNPSLIQRADLEEAKAS